MTDEEYETARRVLIKLLQIGDKLTVILANINPLTGNKIKIKCKIIEIDDKYIYYLFPNNFIHRILYDCIHLDESSMSLFTYHNGFKNYYRYNYGL